MNLSGAQGSISRVGSARATFGRARTSAAPPPSSRGTSPAPKSVPPAPIVEESGAFEFGRVISRAFGALTKNFVTFLALTALAAIPERLIVHLIGFDNKLVSQISNLMLILVACALQPAVIRGALKSFSGETPTFGDCVAIGLSSFFPVLGITLLNGLGIGLASIALIAPGIFLMLSWSVVLPVRVAEGKSIGDCFSRSMALTRNHRWKILGLGMLLVLMSFLVAVVLLPLWGLPFSSLVIFMTQNWLERLLLTTMSAICVASLYRELRLAEEAAAASPADGVS